ncbi:rpsT [Symbiodinium natans]|uniref:RpsT protein n=1 Tax=Symbiodinium natans TaxID=878477 RepID=A0A812S5L2_9DINO|nr:rpsT [Symbiodinium natans]
MFMPRASGWKSWVDSRTQGAMGPRLTSALWPAGLLVASLLCFAPGFLCPSGPSGPSVSGRAGQQRVLAWSSSRPSSQFGPGSSQTAVLLAAACLAASTCRIFRRAQDSRPAACHVATVVPQDSVAGLAFAGATTVDKVTSTRGKVARRSLYSCYTLYFRRWRYYEDRARRNLRNRAYNIFMKNKYKKAMKKVLRYGNELEYGDLQPASHDEVMEDVKEMMDEACEIIDEVTVQGVIHRNAAAKRKDRMFRAILRGSIRKGLLKKPDEGDPDSFLPAYKIIGYEIPECNYVREPRPWQLPGWKSPWMLKWEWEKWRKLTGRK